MDNLEEKINSVLSSPDQMAKILSMVQSLSGSDDKEEESAPREDGGGEPGHSGLTDVLGALGGDGLGSLLGALGGGGDGLGQLLSGLGPDTLPFLVSLLSVYNEKDDSRAHLLRSLHPYLSDQRRGKVDRAVQYMRIARTVKAALDHFKEEG